MHEYTINDERTRFCAPRMRINGGDWIGRERGWVFRSASDCANALAELYRATRASLDQRDQLAEMIADGTAALAWEMNLDAIGPEWARSLDSREAARLIAAGKAVRRVLGRHPLDDLPAQVGDDRFDTSAFEAMAQARRERVRRAA
jgi:hypothetical protein